MNSFVTNTDQLGIWMKAHPIVAGIMLVWIFAWKGVALWKAAKKNDIGWYVGILVINLLGVLEILYIFFFSERKRKEKKNEE